MCASGLEKSNEKVVNTKVLEKQLQKLLAGSSHLQVHAQASLKLLMRKKLRSKIGSRFEAKLDKFDGKLEEKLENKENELESKLDYEDELENKLDVKATPASQWMRQISAPAAVQQMQEVKEVQPEEERPVMRREAKSALLHHSSTCPGYGRPTPGFWPSFVVELFQNVRREKPVEAASESGFRLMCGSFQMPHPQKASTGGEDSLFVCPNGSAAGVADGVGEWQWRFGLDPRAFADELMFGVKTAGEHTRSQAGLLAEARARLMLSEGYQATSSFGSATALVAALDPNGEGKLGVANLGDSGLRVLRWSESFVETPNAVHIAFRTLEQQHAFNCPFQLARLPEPKDYEALREKGMASLVRAVERSGRTSQDLPSHADAYTFEVQEGDVVVLGTDGFFDNLHDSEVCQLAQVAMEATFRNKEKSAAAQIDPTRLAQAYAEAARVRSEDTAARTPFGDLARQAGLQHMGGKMDDISVVVAVVVK
eukprot:CAMPEP_0181508664 /NCGR_PEP_ID=MMETSP1110-20121109/59885_1 /TAXON_ID=174948 /ORGANISM="Symbiodinium sp., Strain CCMP421" /LENGTH=482 /DNA_ID=CAMNT_0023638077 /DNA_START=18 /DNA_END=1463 /DNA_ORIENTATION=-